jgi:hypothetical protein
MTRNASLETQRKFFVVRSGKIRVPCEPFSGGEFPAIVEQVSGAKIYTGIMAVAPRRTSVVADLRRPRENASQPVSCRSRKNPEGSDAAVGKSCLSSPGFRAGPPAARYADSEPLRVAT